MKRVSRLDDLAPLVPDGQSADDDALRRFGVVRPALPQAEQLILHFRPGAKLLEDRRVAHALAADAHHAENVAALFGGGDEAEKSLDFSALLDVLEDDLDVLVQRGDV